MKKKFWLYWDPVSHNIQSVSPVEQPDLAVYPSMKIDYETGLAFLRGDKTMSDWWVGGFKDAPFLTQNRVDLVPANLGEMLHIPRLRNHSGFCGVAATVFLASDTIEFTIPKHLIGTKVKTIREKELKFLLTKRNNPEHLLKEITVSWKKLLSTGSVKIPLGLPIKYSDFSLITNQVFNDYRFEVIRSIWQRQEDNQGIKANNLVSYQIVDEVLRYEKGVVIHHDSKKNILEVSIQNGANLMSYDESDGILFLTKPRDATIILHHVTIDLAALSNEQKLEFKLPDDIGIKWAMGGTPIADKVFFTRT